MKPLPPAAIWLRVPGTARTRAPNAASRVWDVLHQRTELAAEVAAELVEDIRPHDGPVLVDQLRQRHPIDASRVCNFLQRDAPALSKRLLSDELLKPESEHGMNTSNKN